MKKIYMTLVMLFAIAASMAQPREIKGVVHDENDKPMSGVTVYVQETGAGTITGSKGTYSIKIPGPKSEITFSFMGYKTLKLKADDPKAKFDVIKLVPDQQMLDAVEVVQVGYGTQKKVNLLGSAENVSVKDLENRPITQASMALQGTISGIDVVQNSGQPGQDQGSIRIRGVSSIANNNEPLVLIDGVEGDINQVNPKDIESMSVLKDASSAAIYGNRAAAGVVLITTKSGEGSGELKVSYNGSFSLQETTALPKPVKVLEWLDLKEEMFLYNGEIKNYDSDREKYISGEKVSVNYYLRHFRIAPMHDHYLSMSMGGKNYNGSVSLGYGNQDGVLKGTDNEKISFRSNVSMYSTNRKFFTTLNLSGYRKDMTSTAMGTNQTIQDIHRAGPTSIFKAYNGLYGFYGRHMGQLEAGGRTKNVSNQLTAKISAGVEPVKGLKIQGSFATVYFNSRNDQFVAPIYTVGDLYGDVQNKVASFIEIKNSTTLSTTTELTASYKKRFDQHDLSVLAGASQYWWRNEWEMARRDNMSSFTPSLNMGDPATQVNDNAINERATRSLFGRVNYSYDDRYLFEVNVRYDGSSRFYNKKWGLFPSVAAGWRISQESFFKNSGVTEYINNLKLRVSWGRLGNEYISSNYTGYPTLSTDSYYDFNGTQVAGAAITELSNKDTSWETSEQTNIGLDIGIWNRFSLTADIFYKKTTDILMKLPIPPSLIGNVNGGPYQNAGSMENKGLELTLNYRQTYRNKMYVDATFTTTFLRNKILDLKGVSPVIHASLPIVQMEGHPVGAYYGYRMAGVYQFDDFTWQNDSDPSVPLQDRVYKLKEGRPVPSEGSPRPGDLKFADLSGPDGKPDGKIDLDYDRTIIGDPFPDVSMSLNLNWGWKGIDFNMFWQTVLGRDMYNQGPMVVPFYNDNGNVWKDMVDKRWTADNPTNRHPRMNYDSKTANTRSSYYIYDASFLRLKNIELGYTLPVRWTAKLHMSKVRIYAGIQNAWTLTNFPGWDPERPSTNIASEVYPQIRIYNFGLNIGF